MLKRILVLALVLVTGLSMNMNLYAEEPEEQSGLEDRPWGHYFGTRLYMDEGFVKYEYGRGYEHGYLTKPSANPWGPQYEEKEYEYVYRKIGEASVKVGGDETVADFVQLTVEKDSKLTVEPGVTLTIYGNLIVEGTLVNKGTIVIGGEKVKQTYEESGEPLCKITNYGSVSNAGAITVTNGMIENIGTGKIENKGTIGILKLKEKAIGISNSEIKKSYGLEYGTISNSGTISVLSETGIGIYNYKGSTIDNAGVINKRENAVVKGEITGANPFVGKSG